MPEQRDRERPPGAGAAFRRGSSGKSWGAQAPGSVPVSLELLASLGVRSGVSASSAVPPTPHHPPPPLFFFCSSLFPPHIAETLLVTLTAGSDNYVNLGYGSDPCYR